MATHYVLCPCCGQDHSSERFLQEKSAFTEGESRLMDGEECKICRITDSYRSNALRDFGKDHNSDCRFLRPTPSSHYHRSVRGYGDAVAFDLPVHPWNCAGHSHCKHGALGVVEERAGTMLRNSYDKYTGTYNSCACRSHNRAFHVFFPHSRL